MPPEPIHRLLGPAWDWTVSRVACGTRIATHATWDATLVTCPQCRQERAPARLFPSEKALADAVRKLARAHGWLYYHTHDSRHSPAGYPDLTLVKGTRLVFAELKMPGQRPTVEQRQWLDALRQVERVEMYLWTPEDWPIIEETLRCPTEP
jgi:hypothetical protein